MYQVGLDGADSLTGETSNLETSGLMSVQVWQMISRPTLFLQQTETWTWYSWIRLHLLDDSKHMISKILSMRLTGSANIDNSIKWSAVVVFWTAVVYCCLIIQKHTSHFNSLLTPMSSVSGLGRVHFSDRDTDPRPVQHVYYLKTHKTGSTSIYSILAEYCRSRDLLPLLPIDVHINNQPPFSPSQVQLDPNITAYDMVFNHHVYDHNIFKYLHNDTFRFTTLREPFNHFVSSFTYFRDTENFPYLNKINSSNPMGEFLADRLKYEVKGYASFTNNRQSMDLGYNLTHSFDDLAYTQSFITDTDRRFHLVLITGYFHQSLILLKRRLNWSTGDIVYYRKLATKRTLNVSKDLLEIYRAQHKNFSNADIELYKHFLSVFKDRLSREIGLEGEVKEFETILEKVYSFCDKVRAKNKDLVIVAGRWSSHIHISYSKCKWLKLDEVSFTRHLQAIRKFIPPKRY